MELETLLGSDDLVCNPVVIDRLVLRGYAGALISHVTKDMWSELSRHSRVRLADEFVLTESMPSFIKDDVCWSHKLFNRIGDLDKLRRIVTAIPLDWCQGVALELVNLWSESTITEPLITSAIVTLIQRSKPDDMCFIFEAIRLKLDSNVEGVRRDGQEVLRGLYGDDSDDDVSHVENSEKFPVRSLKECLDVLRRNRFNSEAQTVSELASATKSEMMSYPWLQFKRMVKDASDREILCFGYELVQALFGIRDECNKVDRLLLMGQMVRKQAAVKNENCIGSIRFMTNIMLSDGRPLGDVLNALECLSVMAESLASTERSENIEMKERPTTIRRMSLAEMKEKGIKTNRFCSAPKLEDISINYLRQVACEFKIPLEKVAIFRSEVEAVQLAEKVVTRIHHLTE